VGGSAYHIASIPRGTYGDPDKVFEEVCEFVDASDQGNSIMALTELSDVIGAIEGYLEKYHPSICIYDLQVMSAATHRAFQSGRRVSGK